MHNDVVATAEKAREKSVLPNSPNEKKVWETYFEIAMDKLITDISFED